MTRAAARAFVPGMQVAVVADLDPGVRKRRGEARADFVDRRTHQASSWMWRLNQSACPMTNSTVRPSEPKSLKFTQISSEKL